MVAQLVRSVVFILTLAYVQSATLLLEGSNTCVKYYSQTDATLDAQSPRMLCSSNSELVVNSPFSVSDSTSSGALSVAGGAYVAGSVIAQSFVSTGATRSITVSSFSASAGSAVIFSTGPTYSAVGFDSEVSWSRGTMSEEIFTILQAGLYSIQLTAASGSLDAAVGVTRNQSPSTPLGDYGWPNLLLLISFSEKSASNDMVSDQVIVPLNTNDVLRVHTAGVLGTLTSADMSAWRLTITRIY